MLWSVLSNLALNARYRTQRTADLLLALAALMRAHALRIAPDAPPDDESDATGGVAELLGARPRWPTSCRPRAMWCWSRPARRTASAWPAC